LETVPPGFQHGVEFDKPSRPDSNILEKMELKGGIVVYTLATEISTICFHPLMYCGPMEIIFLA